MELANIALTVILSGIALVAIIIRGVKSTIRKVLVEEGIIRPLRPGAQETHWPNGYRNLPDTLEGLRGVLTKHLEDGDD